ncbi:MAG: sugar phosphate isomerase/epimerase family protein [Vicinamibacterales bacterium]
MPPRFGLSTRIVHDAALDAGHISLFARYGFTTLELAATRTHLDYANPEALRNLRTWLADAGATLHAVRAPRADGLRGRTWVAPFSLSSDDGAERRKALDEAKLALAVAQTLPFDVLAVHLERPRGTDGAAAESPGSARRSLEDLATAASDLGVRLALVSGGGPISTPESLVRIIELDLEDSTAGICLDFAQAQSQGGVVDAIEEASEHLTAALLPTEGSIDWGAAMMGIQKIGYDGVLLFDVPRGEHLEATLQRTDRARQRLDDLLRIF